MKSFITFIVESIRQGLPHITKMTRDQFAGLTQDGKVHVNKITEKTDGMTHMMGHDEHGFYTQSSGSGNEKMRSAQDFVDRATRRSQETGKPLDLTAAHAFGHIHSILQANKGLQDHLRSQYEKSGEEVKIRGEAFYKPLSTPSETTPGEIKFVGTSYDPSHMGSVGSYIIHSQLPENHHVNLEHFKSHLSTPEMNFDDDVIKHTPAHIDVSNEVKEYHGLNHELLAARTSPKNKEAKEAENAKFDAIKQKVSDKVDAHVKSAGLTPKWGSGSEGIVVHPSSENSQAPRFKVTSDTFRAYKANPENAANFKKRQTP